MNIRKLILLVFTVCMAAFCSGGDTISYNIKELIPIARDRQTTDILVPYRLDGKWGFVNQRLEKITDAVYDNILVVSKYCAYVKKDDNRIIVSADRIDEIISETRRHCGGITIMPLFGAHRTAERVLLRARVGSRGGATLDRGLPMNYEPVLRDGLTIDECLDTL